MRHLTKWNLHSIDMTFSEIDLNIIASDNVIHIEDSYKVKNPFTMYKILNNIQKELESIITDNVFTYRSKRSMVREWIAHNNAYILKYKVERTKDVDLEKDVKWYMKILYFVTSLVIL